MESTSSSTTKFAGLVRDASDTGKFILFSGNQTEPTTTVDPLALVTNATLKANLEGNLSGGWFIDHHSS